MEPPRTLRPRNPNVNYQVVKRTRSRSSSTGSTHSKRRSKPKPIEDLDASSSTTTTSPPPLFSPSLSLQKLSVHSSTESDSSTALPSHHLQKPTSTSSLDFYKRKMKELAETYREIVNRGLSSSSSSLQTQSSSPSPSSSSKRNSTSRHSQEDIHNANLLLLLRMIA
ncbi:hypothetical protein CJF32_00009039 [Rutstroemia sp. NJR-2017a WRK4]|nr:hypothetical protein CJF32_00009039 [Rutstroemia sp. NJR-2017a WRK4]